VVRKLAKLPLVSLPAGFRIQPIEADDGLPGSSSSRSQSLVVDVGGPRVYGADELLRGYLLASKRRRRQIVPLWQPGNAARVFRAGSCVVWMGVRCGMKLWLPGEATHWEAGAKRVLHHEQIIA